MKPQLGQQQQAGVDPADRLVPEVSVATIGIDEAVAFRVPGPLQDGLADPVGMAAPVFRPLVQAELGRDAREPVAGGPAHHGRVGVHALGGAQLPQAGVGLVVKRIACSPSRSSRWNSRRRRGGPAAGRRRPAPRPGPRCRRRRAGSGHRPGCRRAPAPCRGSRPEPASFALDQLHFQGDAVHRLERPLAGAGHDVGDVAEVVLHRRRGAQAVERAHDEVGVAQPAVAVVPVARRARRLGDRGGHRGDDRAGLLERAQLQRDRGADHRVLPLERHRQGARPLPPVVARQLEQVAAALAAPGRAAARPGPSSSVDRVVQDERRLIEHVGDRRVGRQPQHLVGGDVADVVAAAGDRRRATAP